MNINFQYSYTNLFRFLCRSNSPRWILYIETYSIFTVTKVLTETNLCLKDELRKFDANTPRIIDTRLGLSRLIGALSLRWLTCNLATPVFTVVYMWLQQIYIVIADTIWKTRCLKLVEPIPMEWRIPMVFSEWV